MMANSNNERSMDENDFNAISDYLDQEAELREVRLFLACLTCSDLLGRN